MPRSSARLDLVERRVLAEAAVDGPLVAIDRLDPDIFEGTKTSRMVSDRRSARPSSSIGATGPVESDQFRSLGSRSSAAPVGRRASRRWRFRSRPRARGVLAAAVEVERLEPRDSLLGRRLGERDIHHRDAADRPHRHQKREHYAEPAVDQERHAPRPARRPRKAGEAPAARWRKDPLALEAEAIGDMGGQRGSPVRGGIGVHR